MRILVDQITSCPGFVHDHLPAIPIKVSDFGVPKFKLDFTSKIVEILKQLGLVLPFGMGSDSGWTRSGPGPNHRLDRPPAVRSGPDRAMQRS